MSVANMKEIVDIFESYLQNVLPESEITVRRAMDYSLSAGGKRIRPYILLEFFRVCSGGDIKKALPFAAALEMIHTYSLIHDDLPCMDNDDFRRGKPTNHKVYGEAMATLAGDGLLTEAFSIALSSDLSPEIVVACTKELANSAGLFGMLGGQSIDVESEKEGRALSEKEMRFMYSMKTGALIRCACTIGAIAAGADENRVAAARNYGEQIGLAFQIIDDILDVEGTFEELGKPIGSDERNNKSTFATIMSIENARAEAKICTEKAIAFVEVFEQSGNLVSLANLMYDRKM